MNKSTWVIMGNLVVIALLVADQYLTVGNILENITTEQALKVQFAEATSRLTNTFLIANGILFLANLLLYRNWVKSNRWLGMVLILLVFNSLVCFANFTSSMEKVQIQLEAFQQEDGKSASGE